MSYARTRFWLATGLSFAVWLAMVILGGGDWAVDQRYLARLSVYEDTAFARNAALLTNLGGWQVLTGLTIAFAVGLAFKRKLRAALLLIIVFGGRLLVELQKVMIDRARPGQSPYLEAVSSNSFPSGHAANAMITYLAIAFLVPVRQRHRAIAMGLGFAAALQIGWSRVALGVHWPSDVIGGWAFGMLWITICIRMATDRPGE
ncbi:MAG TPA: phosphatase PAP2 family protein [Allosphingosinicella sp.]|nr:phosphatase PAP2 family protein [Allosphingosinicella sp.]